GSVYVEWEHKFLVRVADANGQSDADRPTVPGRPRRDGGGFVSVAIVDKARGTVVVRALDSAGTVLWETPLSLGDPVWHIVLADSDAEGSSYVGGVTGRESATPPYRIGDEHVVLVRLAPTGAETGRIVLPYQPSTEEAEREFTVADDGTVYWMQRSSTGVTISPHRF